MRNSMRRLITGACLLVLSFGLLALLLDNHSPAYPWSFAHITGKVAAQFNIELPCPAGTTPASSTLTITLNPTNNFQRINFCVDNTTGHLIFQGDTSAL